VQQLEFWERPRLSADQLSVVGREIRNLYWYIRMSRRGVNDARRRKVYRKILVHKKRLLEAGVSKQEILVFLRCCRAQDCRQQGCLDCVERTAKKYAINLT